MKTQIFKKATNLKFKDARTDRSSKQNKSIIKINRSNSSHSIQFYHQKSQIIKISDHCDLPINIKEVKMNSKLLKDIIRQQQVLVKQKLFDPKQFFGANKITENIKLNVFEKNRIVKSSLSRTLNKVKSQKRIQNHSSVKLSKSKVNKQIHKKSIEIMNRSHSKNLNSSNPKIFHTPINSSVQLKKISLGTIDNSGIFASSNSKQLKENMNPNFISLKLSSNKKVKQDQNKFKKKIVVSLKSVKSIKSTNNTSRFANKSKMKIQ